MAEKTQKQLVIEALIDAGDDWITVKDVSLASGLKRQQALSALFGLKYAGEAERDGDKWRLISSKSKSKPMPSSVADDDDDEDDMIDDSSEDSDDVEDDDDPDDSLPQNNPVKEKVSSSFQIPNVQAERDVVTNSKAISSPSQDSNPKEEVINFDDALDFPDPILPGPTEEHKERGLNAKINDIESKLDMALGAKQKKEKKAKLKKMNLRKVKKFNRAKSRSVILLGNNKNIKVVKGEFLAGMVRIGQNYYDGSAMYVWMWEGKQPIYIIPEWSIRPLCSEEIYLRAVKDQTMIDSQIITIRAAKMVEQDTEAGQQKKPMKPIMWIFLGIAVIIVGYIIMGGIN